MRWAGHVACMGERRGAYRVLMGILKERGHLEDLGIDGTVMLILVFSKWDGVWTGLIWLGLGTGCGLL